MHAVPYYITIFLCQLEPLGIFLRKYLAKTTTNCKWKLLLKHYLDRYNTRLLGCPIEVKAQQPWAAWGRGTIRRSIRANKQQSNKEPWRDKDNGVMNIGRLQTELTPFPTLPLFATVLSASFVAEDGSQPACGLLALVTWFRTRASMDVIYGGLKTRGNGEGHALGQ